MGGAGAIQFPAHTVAIVKPKPCFLTGARPSRNKITVCSDVHGGWPPMKSLFRTFSHKVAEAVGTPWAFLAGVGVTLIWAATGPLFRYSDTWQLVINTGTTIITFLMVFLI